MIHNNLQLIGHVKEIVKSFNNILLQMKTGANITTRFYSCIALVNILTLN